MALEKLVLLLVITGESYRVYRHHIIIPYCVLETLSEVQLVVWDLAFALVI